MFNSLGTFATYGAVAIGIVFVAGLCLAATVVVWVVRLLMAL